MPHADGYHPVEDAALIVQAQQLDSYLPGGCAGKYLRPLQHKMPDHC